VRETFWDETETVGTTDSHVHRKKAIAGRPIGTSWSTE